MQNERQRVSSTAWVNMARMSKEDLAYTDVLPLPVHVEVRYVALGSCYIETR